MTIRTVYVDPLNGSASPTDPTDSGDAYNTMQNATVGEAADLVSTTITLVIKGIDTATDTGELYVNGYTVDSTYFITYTYQTGSKSDGIAGGSGYLINPADQVIVRENYTVFEGVGIDVSNATTPDPILVVDITGQIEFRKCLIIDRSSRPNTMVSDAQPVLIEDCMLVETSYLWGSGLKLYNVAIYSIKSQTVGVRNAECYNVVAHVPTQSSGVFFSCTGDYNSGFDATAPGANSRDNQTLADIDFKVITSEAEDLHIESTSEMIDQGIGTTQAGVSATDFDGDARGVSVCAIGADELGAAPTGRPLPQRVLSGPFSGPLNGVF